MASPLADSYSATSGTTIYGGRTAPSAADYPMPDSVLRVSDGSTTHTYVSAYGYVKWSHAYGDWSDAAGLFLGAAPYSSATVTNTGTVKAASWDVTTLVRRWCQKTAPNNGVCLIALTGGAQTNFATRENGSNIPTLVITLADTSVVTLNPLADTYLTGGLSAQGTDIQMHVTGGEPSYLWFDVSSITQVVNSAILTLTSIQQYGVDATVGVVRGDLSLVQPTLPVTTGIANSYLFDTLLETHPDVYFIERFPDLLIKSGRPTGKQWNIDIGNIPGFQYVVTGPDPAYPAYTPLYPGSTALKTGVQGLNDGGGGFVQLSNTWLFWNNTGSEPDEAYIRYMVFFTDTWDGGNLGGKLPGFYSNYPHSGVVLKPDAPAYSGNGGSPTFGMSGWTARAGFQSNPRGYSGGTPGVSPVFDAGYRHMGFEDIYTPPDHMPDVVDTNYGGYYTEGAAYNVYGARTPWNARGLMKKNQWHCIEMHVKLNTIDTSGTTKAYFGNTHQTTGNFNSIVLQYRDPASAKQGTDTSIDAYSQVRSGNNSGYMYLPSETTPYQSNGLYPGPDTAILTSPGVGRWDGLLECWVDGQLAFSRPNWLFRHIANVQIQAFGLNLQHGGTSPYNPNTMNLYITNIVASKSRIGSTRLF